jgi:hypothetical protein
MNGWRFVNFNLGELSFIIEGWFERDRSRPRVRGVGRVRIALDWTPWPINAPKCPKHSAGSVGGSRGQSGMSSYFSARLWETEGSVALSRLESEGDINTRQPHCPSPRRTRRRTHCSGQTRRCHRPRHDGENSRRRVIPPRLQPIPRLHPRCSPIRTRVRVGALQRLVAEGQGLRRF